MVSLAFPERTGRTTSRCREAAGAGRPFVRRDRPSQEVHVRTADTGRYRCVQRGGRPGSTVSRAPRSPVAQHPREPGNRCALRPGSRQASVPLRSRRHVLRPASRWCSTVSTKAGRTTARVESTSGSSSDMALDGSDLAVEFFFRHRAIASEAFRLIERAIASIDHGVG